MAQNKDKAKDSFKEWAIGSFHRFNKMTQSLGNMVAGVQPPKSLIRYVQSDSPNGEFLPLSWTREMLHRFASPPLSLQDIIQADKLDSKTQKEVIRIMLLRFVQLDEDLDKMFDYASPPSPGELSRITQSQTCTYDIKAICDSRTVHLQNAILQADTPDSETTVAVPREMVLRCDHLSYFFGNMFTGEALPAVFISSFEQSSTSDSEFNNDSPSLQSEEAISETCTSHFEAKKNDTPDSEEMRRVLKVRFVGLDHTFDKMVVVAQPPVPTSPYEHSSSSDSELNNDRLPLPTEEAISSPICDIQPINLQNFVAKTDTPESEELRRVLMLRSAEVDQKLVNMVDEPLPPLRTSPYEESSSSDSELKSDSLSVPSEEAISETCSCDFEAIGDTQPINIQIFVVQTHSPMPRFEQSDQNLDNIVDDPLPSVLITPYEESSSSNSELKSDSLSLQSEEAISETCTCDYEAICDTQPPEPNLQNFVVQTESAESEEMGRISMLRLDGLDQSIDNMVVVAQPPELTTPYEESSSSDSESKNDSQSLQSEEEISETCTCDFVAIGDTQPPGANLQNFVVQTESPELQEMGRISMLRLDGLDQGLDNLVDEPLPPLRISPYEESGSSDSELKSDTVSLPSEEAISDTCTCDFEAMGDTQPDNLPNSIVQTESPESQEMGRISMLRSAGLVQCIDNLVDVAQPPELITPYEESSSSDSELKNDSQSLPSEEAISQTGTSEFEAICDSQTDNLQNFAVQTDQPDSETTLKLGKVMPPFEQSDQNLDNLVDNPLPPVRLIPYEESSSSDSELKSDSLSLQSEEAISQTCTRDVEAIGDSQPDNLPNSNVRTDQPDSETMGDPLPKDLLVQTNPSDLEAKVDSMSSTIEDAFTQTATSDFKANLSYWYPFHPDGITQTETFDSETMECSVQTNTSDLETKDDSMSLALKVATAQTDTSDFMVREVRDSSVQTITTNSKKEEYSPSLALHKTETPYSETMDCSVQTNSSDLETKDDSMSLTLKVATAQTDTSDFMVSEVRDSSVQTITTDSKKEEYSPSLALQNKAKDLPVPQEVPQLFQEFLELQLQNVAEAVEIPEVVELMKLPKLLKGLNELELLAVLKILRTLDLPIIPNAMKVPRELLDVQQVLVDVSNALEVLEVHQVFDVPKEPEAEGSEVQNVLQKPKNMPKLLKRPIVAVVPTVRAVPGESQVSRVMQSLDNCDNFEMTLLGKNGKKLLAFNFKKF